MKLILDEKKIRKGRAVGLPYQGSKKKISKKIIEIIKQNFDIENKKIYDIFGGGGAITAECIINGLPVHYNDLDSTAADMFVKVLESDREYLKGLIVSREEFFRIRDREHKTVDDELRLLVNSFGYNRVDYLYSREISNAKYQLAREIIDNHDTFNGYKQTETYEKAISEYKNDGLKRLQSMERLNNLQQLSHLQQIERLVGVMDSNTEVDGLTFSISTHPYRRFGNLKDQILYLDPPYKSTKSSYKESLNHSEFNDWCVDMAQNNIVLISGYELPDDRFECVFEFKKAKSTYQGGVKVNGKHEKLFMVKGGKGNE